MFGKRTFDGPFRKSGGNRAEANDPHQGDYINADGPIGGEHGIDRPVGIRCRPDRFDHDTSLREG